MSTLAGLTQMMVLKELVEASEKGKHCLTLDELAEMISAPRRNIVKRMQALMYNGYAKTVKIGCYAATPNGHKREMDGGEIKSGPNKNSKVNYRAPNNDSLRARLWRSIRTLKQGSTSDFLQCAAKPEEVANGRDTASRLLSQLTRAGYVRKLTHRKRPKRECSNGEVVYFLLKNTGNICPIERTDKETGQRGLLDRNTKEFFPYNVAQPRPKAVRATS